MWKVVITTTVVYFLYLLLGGCIFSFLVLINEFDVGGMTRENKSEYVINFTDMHIELLENGFELEEIDAVTEVWNAKIAERFLENSTGSLETRSWTYANAFYFAFHLCTTIGYGDIAPKTAHAQMLACLYAAIGIPLNILFFKLLGESFARSYQETIWRIKGDEDSPKKRMYADLAFFIPWTLVFFLLPSIVYTLTEEWDVIEGLYFSFITLSTIGLGDYVAGGGVTDPTYYVLYKLSIFVWMIYGLAFTTMIVDYITHLYQIYLLFEFSCKWKKCQISFKRTYVDIEKLDVHFKLLRLEGAKNKYSIWNLRRTTILSFDFHTQHLADLAVLAEKMQGQILKLLEEFRSASDITVKKVPKDAFPMKVKVPRDVFPVKVQKDEDDTEEDRNSKL